MFTWWILLFLGIWALVEGLLKVTNLKFEQMNLIAGFSALILGILAII